ncbi:MAG: nuclear transport factor 2 family protein [Bacteroidota bacterium]
MKLLNQHIMAFTKTTSTAAQKTFVFIFAVLLSWTNYAAAQDMANYPPSPIQPTPNYTDMDTLTVNLAELKRGTWSGTETKNAELIVDFVQHLMNDHDFDYIRKNFMNARYLQHNRNLPDGIEGLLAYVERIAKQYPEYTYDVKHIYADGDYVMFHSQATIKKKHRGNPNKGFNIIDTWKIEDGQIVEHWDAIQPIDGSARLLVWMTGGKVRNGNGLY